MSPFHSLVAWTSGGGLPISLYKYQGFKFPKQVAKKLRATLLNKSSRPPYRRASESESSPACYARKRHVAPIGLAVPEQRLHSRLRPHLPVVRQHHSTDSCLWRAAHLQATHAPSKATTGYHTVPPKSSVARPTWPKVDTTPTAKLLCWKQYV